MYKCDRCSAKVKSIIACEDEQVCEICDHKEKVKMYKQWRERKNNNILPVDFTEVRHVPREDNDLR